MSKPIKNIILFLVGFCVYITIEVIFRGYSFPLMGCVGGITLLVLDKVNNKISWNIDISVYGLIGSCVVTLSELIIGETFKLFNKPPMWDYSTIPFNFDGVICLPFSIAWFFLSFVGVFIADSINYYVFEELPVPYYKLFGRVIIRFKEKHCKLNNK